MIPTQNLMEDHRKIERMLDVLEAVTKAIEAGETVERDHLTQMLDFLRRFADHYHHGREEKLLFPSMEQAGVPREGGPIGVMLMEHALGRNYIAGMQAALETWQEESAVSHFIDQTRGYISLLRGHIYKEDQVLFPMAERMLDAVQKEALTAQFIQAEAELLNEEARRTFMRALEDFTVLYLANRDY